MPPPTALLADGLTAESPLAQPGPKRATHAERWVGGDAGGPRTPGTDTDRWTRGGPGGRSYYAWTESIHPPSIIIMGRVLNALAALGMLQSASYSLVAGNQYLTCQGCGVRCLQCAHAPR